MEIQNVFKKVYLWMFVGLLVSFGVGYFVSLNTNMLYNIFQTNMYIFLPIIEIVLVIVLSAGINKFNAMTAKILFLLYSFVTGLTFSVIFVAYSMSSILLVFGVTALVFLVLALLGYTTKVDLSKLGTILLVFLLGIILVTLINIFLGNTMLDIILCIIGVGIFMGYIAYDTQKIKLLASTMVDEDKVAIIGALELYLDFINLFLRLLQLFGKSND